MKLYDQIQEALTFLKEKTSLAPKYGIVLGTGLGNLTSEIKVNTSIPYQEIPHFPTSTVEGHKGELIFGTLEGQPVVAMSGRFHFYEGYSMKEVTFPIRVMAMLGIRKILISNAAGGTNAAFYAGDLVIVRDHINLQPSNPLRGENDERLGPRFPDMLETYDKNLINSALAIARKNDLPVHTGVYVSLPGPNLETPAEYQYLNTIGGDLVGMSTVPEVLVAKHQGLAVFVVSVVTNRCFPISEIGETTLEDVLEVARSAEPKMTLLVKELIRTDG